MAAKDAMTNPAKRGFVTPAVYRDPWAHLQDRLDLLDARLHLLVMRMRAERPTSESTTATGWGHGAFVTDQEIDELLDVSESSQSLGAREAETQAAEAASIAAGVDLPLLRLSRIFQLSPWEEEVLILCLAPELDRKYQRIFGYLHDDLTRREPSIELALALRGGDLSTRAQGLAALHDNATLFRAGLVVPNEEGTDGTPRLARTIRLGTRIVDGLLGRANLPPTPWLRSMRTVRAEAEGLAPRLLAIAQSNLRGDAGGGKLFVSLFGGGQPAAADVAAQVCGHLDVPLLQLDLSLLTAAGVPFQKTVRDAAREALLQPAALLVECGDGLGQNQPETDLRMAQIVEALEEFAWLVFLHARHPVAAPVGSQQAWYTAQIPPPDLKARASAWMRALDDTGLILTQADGDSLVARYRLGISQIETTVASAQLQARLRGATTVSLIDVEAACRDLGASALSGLATRISPKFTWSDIVLPADALRQLEEIVSAVRSRRRVLADWGFGTRLSRGKGLSALFSGAPGTGKTMAAEIIAGELGLDLFTVDLATVVSKYIGETEKNLSRIFDAAESTSSVLFFDEADSLFGKRSEVKEAHDRYANIEISYLLQRIDTYEGLVVLATNLKGNLDEAFLRRLNFVLDMPFPEATERRRIWQRLPSEEMPPIKDVDWEFLAERFALAGGNIKGAFLHATYQAAARNEPVNMSDLVLGLRRELDKMGKVSSAGDFGRYWPLAGRIN